MVAGLVAVRILADQTGNVGLRAAGRLLGSGKQGIQPRFEGLSTAKGLDQAGDILRHEEAVLPGIGLRIVVVDLARIEGGEPASVKPGAHKEGFRIQHVLPVLRAGHKLLIFSRMSEQFRNLCHAPVVVGVLEGLRDAFVFVVRQHEAVTAETVEPEFGIMGRGDHGLESFFVVKAPQAAHHRIRENRRSVVADHTVRLITGKLPDGEFALLLIDRDHRADEIHRTLGLDFGQQRMQAAEGIPKREHRVALPSFGLVHLPVHSAVLAVDVGVQRRMDGRMVEGRIKAFLMLRVVIRAGYFLQIGLPGLFSGLFLRLQRFRILTHQILPGVFPGNGRNACAKGQFPAFESDVGAGVDDADSRCRFGEFDIEIDPLVARPAVRAAEAVAGLSFDVDVAVFQGVAVFEVNGNAGAFGETILVNGTPSAGRETGLDTGIL